MKNTKVSLRQWMSFILATLVANLTWALENNYLVRFLEYNTSEELALSLVPVMIAVGAVAATIATIVIGALSDKIGKRRIFANVGYIAWGLSVILFAFVDKNTLGSIFSNVSNVALLSGTLIIVVDAVMNLFGGAANFAAFNAMISDQSDYTNRNKIEGVMASLNLISMLAILFVGAPLIDVENGIEQNWKAFFIIFGTITVITGIICIFLFPKDIRKETKDRTYLHSISYPYKPSSFKVTKNIYMVLISILLLNMGFQIFMPYFVLYIEKYVSFAGEINNSAFILIYSISSAIVFALGFFMNKIKRYNVALPAIGVAIIGALILGFANKNIGAPLLIISGILLMSGYLVVTAILAVLLRTTVPGDRSGQFQGVRVIFAVLIPSLTGPFIGEWLSSINGDGNTPTNLMFFGAAVMFLLTSIPVLYLSIQDKKDKLPKKIGLIPQEYLAPKQEENQTSI